MESSSRSRSHAGSIEENTMAIIDAAGAKDTQDTNDDRTWLYSIESQFSRQPNGGYFIYPHHFVLHRVCDCIFLFLVLQEWLFSKLFVLLRLFRKVELLLPSNLCQISVYKCVCSELSWFMQIEIWCDKGAVDEVFLS